MWQIQRHSHLGARPVEPKRGRPRCSSRPARPEEACRDSHLYADLHEQSEREVHAHDCRLASEAGKRPEDYQCEARTASTMRDGTTTLHRANRLSERKACRQEVSGEARPKAFVYSEENLREDRQ